MTITINYYNSTPCYSSSPSDSNNLQAESHPVSYYNSYAIVGDYNETLPLFNRKIDAFLKKYSRELERSGNRSPSSSYYYFGTDQCASRVYLVHFIEDFEDNVGVQRLNEVEVTEWLNNNEEFKCPTLLGRVLDFFAREKCGNPYCGGCNHYTGRKR